MRLRYGLETPGATSCIPCHALVASTELVFVIQTAISILYVVFGGFFHRVAAHVIMCFPLFTLFWSLSRSARHRLVRALFGNSPSLCVSDPVDAWQIYLNKRDGKEPSDKSRTKKPAKLPKQNQLAPTSVAKPRAPWASLGLVIDFSDGQESLPQLKQITQNARGIFFYELSEMEHVLSVRSSHSFANFGIAETG